MQEIPLFPLKTVLFPGAPLRLHIFEERYKQMIQFCLHNEQPFGVVLIRQGMEALGPLAEPHLVGTTAKIIQVQHLPDRQMNLATVGQERFRVLSLEPDLQSYLIGYTELFPVVRSDPVLIQNRSLQLRRIVKRYLDVVKNAGIGELDLANFPEDPIEYAFLAASLLEITDRQKQAILGIEGAENLLAEITNAFSREVALLRALTKQPVSGGEIFSRN